MRQQKWHPRKEYHTNRLCYFVIVSNYIVICRCSVANYNCIKELQLKWFMPDFGKSLTWRNRLFLLFEAVAASISKPHRACCFRLQN
jgi:hypothetical protein